MTMRTRLPCLGIGNGVAGVQLLAGWLLAELHRRPGGADHQHVVPHGLVVDVDPYHCVGADLGRLVLDLGRRVADPEASSYS